MDKLSRIENYTDKSVFHFLICIHRFDLFVKNYIDPESDDKCMDGINSNGEVLPQVPKAYIRVR